MTCRNNLRQAALSLCNIILHHFYNPYVPGFKSVSAIIRSDLPQIMSDLQGFKSLLEGFKCESPENTDKAEIARYKVSKKSKTTSKSPIKKENRRVEKINTTNLPDLAPSLASNLIVLFIGYNPGVQSSIDQHHFAHHSNLFWKLFRQSKLLEKVVDVIQEKNKDPHIENPNLEKLLENGCTAENDNELVNYKIGFSDLVLRCTRKADELASDEKYNNIKRLITEIQETEAQNVVLIGKGIWETIIKYYSVEMNIKFKLDKDNFHWGEVGGGNNSTYNKIINYIYSEFSPLKPKIYVFPSTSGLVFGIPFAEKLQLWETMVNNI
ncbi:thp1 [Candida jiufengensis]|uniref:thp1 n=1 Tax=Candida jiufengensis TaxID=497108 RepID=UPI002225237B|nr:thp1 [Candida jiufengensis]KAI5952451.1 thp1 [Candida jiufengensis]